MAVIPNQLRIAYDALCDALALAPHIPERRAEYVEAIRRYGAVAEHLPGYRDLGGEETIGGLCYRVEQDITGVTVFANYREFPKVLASLDLTADLATERAQQSLDRLGQRIAQIEKESLLLSY